MRTRVGPVGAPFVSSPLMARSRSPSPSKSPNAAVARESPSSAMPLSVNTPPTLLWGVGNPMVVFPRPRHEQIEIAIAIVVAPHGTRVRRRRQAGRDLDEHLGAGPAREECDEERREQHAAGPAAGAAPPLRGRGVAGGPEVKGLARRDGFPGFHHVPRWNDCSSAGVRRGKRSRGAMAAFQRSVSGWRRAGRGGGGGGQRPPRGRVGRGGGGGRGGKGGRPGEGAGARVSPPFAHFYA